MFTHKNILIIIIVVALGGVFVWGQFRPADDFTEGEDLPASSESPSPSLSPSPTEASGPVKAPFPTATPDTRTTFMDEPVPWQLLLSDASCRLQGEIKFLDHNTYDNQDALFSYSGVDSPARHIIWTVTPDDDLSIGPNIFVKRELPDGESLIGIVLPEEPKADRYELTVKIQYTRQVDSKGNFVAAGGVVKEFEKQCDGKTTIILP